MSLTITAKNIKFLQDESEHNYVVTVNPAYKPLNIKIEGDYEIAPTGLQSHAFAQELILEPDTTSTPPRIAKMIRIRKKQGAKMGKITHRLGNDAQALYVNLLAEEPEKLLVATTVSLPKVEAKNEVPKKIEPILPIPPKVEAKKSEPIVLPKVAEKKTDATLPNVVKKKDEPISPPKKEVQTPVNQPISPVPTIKSNRKEVFFAKVTEGIVANETLEIQTEHLDKCQLQVTAPFRLSLDNKTFSQILNLQVHRKGDSQQIYVQVLAPKVGTYTAQIACKHGEKVVHNVFVKAIAHKNPSKAEAKDKKSFHLKPIAAAAASLCLLVLAWWMWGNKKEIPQNTPSATVLSTSNMVLPVDPACKPSLYQKLKEKTGAVRYSCVDKNCDTSFVREILTFASGSKAFKYVSVHTAETPNECGQWVDNLFKNNEIDIIYTEKPCNIGNMDMSSSICEDKKCVFMVPCGNSEGFLKVLNKEIRRRKAEKMKAALKIVRDEWKGRG